MIQRLALALVAATVTLTACGSATGAAEAPSPGPTVTKEVVRTEVPSTCLNALKGADEGFRLAGEGFQQASDTMAALSRLDFTTSEIATAKLNRTADKMRPAIQRYQADRDACRKAAKS